MIIIFLKCIIINDNKAVINNNNYRKLQDTVWFLKFPLAQESISSIFIDHLGMRRQKCSPALCENRNLFTANLI